MDTLKSRNHAYSRWKVVQNASCSQNGLRVRACKHCEHQEQQELPLRKHRAGKWQITVPATLNKPGMQVKSCKECGTVLEERSYHPGRRYFAMDFCVGGVAIQDIWPEAKCSWYTFAPVPLTEEAEYRFPLVSQNSMQVGEVLITVTEGYLTIGYTLFGEKNEVLKERMQVFVSGDILTETKLGREHPGRKINKPINIKQTLRGADFALVFLRMDGLVLDDNNSHLFDILKEREPLEKMLDKSYEQITQAIREHYKYEKN